MLITNISLPLPLPLPLCIRVWAYTLPVFSVLSLFSLSVLSLSLCSLSLPSPTSSPLKKKSVIAQKSPRRPDHLMQSHTQMVLKFAMSGKAVIQFKRSSHTLRLISLKKTIEFISLSVLNLKLHTVLLG